MQQKSQVIFYAITKEYSVKQTLSDKAKNYSFQLNYQEYQTFSR